MGNVLFCYPDRLLGSSVYTTALSGGSWSASFPLANLKDKLLTKVARSTNALAASTIINVDLGVARALRLFAILYSNLSPAATVQFAIYTDSGYTNLVHSTGALAVPWSALDAETRAGWRPDFWTALSTTRTGRYVRVTIVDTANPDGYVELGRCLMMPAWQPATNIAWGNPVNYDHSATTIERSLGGVRFAARRRPVRVQRMELPNTTSAEAHQTVLEMQRQLGRDGELFFVHDPDETDFWVRQKSFLATMEEISPLEYPYLNNFSTAFQLVEVV